MACGPLWRLCRIAAACLPLLAWIVPAEAQRDSRADTAVTSALAFLARQQADDGSFEAGGPRIAKTGIALLAYLSAGHTPEVGRYGLTVRRSVDYLVAVVPEDGYFGRTDGSRMYGQGIVTVALAEAYAVESDPQQRVRIRAALESAINVIVKAQQVEKSPPLAGGWRYEPQSTDSDLLVTAWNLLALRAARNVGLDVPQPCFDQGTAFVVRCYRSDASGFANQPQGEVTADATAIGVLLLGLLDSTDRAEASAAAELLATKQLAQSRFIGSTLQWASQAAHRLKPPLQRQMYQRCAQLVLDAQSEDGGWPLSRSADEPGRVFPTALAVMTLQSPQGLLGVFEK
jgi:hypothetical protein